MLWILVVIQTSVSDPAMQLQKVEREVVNALQRPADRLSKITRSRIGTAQSSLGKRHLLLCAFQDVAEVPNIHVRGLARFLPTDAGRYGSDVADGQAVGFSHARTISGRRTNVWHHR